MVSADNARYAERAGVMEFAEGTRFLNQLLSEPPREVTISPSGDSADVDPFKETDSSRESKL